MHRSPRHRHAGRHIIQMLVLLLASAAIAAPIAGARTATFSTASSGPARIDLGLDAPSLGVTGTVRFRTNAADRRAQRAATRQERLRVEADHSRAAARTASNRIAAIETLLLDAQGDEQRLSTELQRRAVDRYTSGDGDELSFLLSSSGLSDLLARRQLVADQAQRDRRLADEYELTIARIEVHKRVLEELRDMSGDRAQRLSERADRLDDVIVAARVGHDEAPADPSPRARATKGHEAEGVSGTWYVMNGAFDAQLFLPNAGSGWDGGTRTPARAATPQQIQQVLTDRRVDFDASGYQDVLTGQIDGRVLDALVLAGERFGYVRVTSLKSDHGIYTSSGNVSEHSYGCAADIGTIGSTVITPSSQTPGGEVNAAVLFFAGLGSVKSDLAPHQVISLFDLGGATLAMGDHGDHIHLGYAC